MRTAMTEAEARSVVIDRRIREGQIVPFKAKDGRRVTAEEQAADPRRGYTLGLMVLDHTITDRQHDAGVRFAEDMARYYGLTGIKFPSARAQNLFAIRGDNNGEDSYRRAEKSRDASKLAGRLRDILLGTGNIDEGRRVVHSVTEVAVLDNPQARKWPDHMLMFIRKGLNRLADHYAIGS